MNPFLIVTGDFVKTGGMDRANYALARYVADRGAETHLVAYRVDPELALRPNVIVHRVPKLLGSYLAGGVLLSRVGQRWAGTVSARGGRVVTNGGNCLWGDINWVHYVHAAFRRASSGAMLQRFKNRATHRFFLAQEQKVLPSAKVLIANSNRTRLDIIGLLGISADRVFTVYYGTDPDEFRPVNADERAGARQTLGMDPARRSIAFVGALSDRRKGFDVVFAAWQRLCADPRWDPDLVVIGTGAELPIWKNRAAVAGLASRIHFLGFRNDVANVMRACDAIVAPTRYEAYGLGVHEALCSGLPAIVSAEAGVAERYPKQLADLLISDPEDAEDVATRLRTWHENAGHFRAAVERLSGELRAHTWDRMAAQLVEIGSRRS